jgi:uncharacterized glyoxalase superfamily protein PhnB
MTPDPMNDPMNHLRRADEPIAPRPEFTAELRARIERELGPIPPGGTMSAITTEPAAERQLRTVTPYLAVSDARAAMAWYEDVFGATVASEPIIMPDGRVGHVELRIGDAVIMMADEFADIDVLGPTSRGGTTVSFVVNVPDVDTTYARAVAAGATAERPPADQFYGERAGWLSDPWGHRWSISTPLAAVPGGLAQRDLGTADRLDVDVPTVDLGGRAEPAPVDVANLGYFTIGVPDVERASAFYSALFGWQPVGEPTEDGRHVSNITPPGGLHGGEPGPSITVYFRVNDIHATVARVRALGGDASEPQLLPSGWNAACHDDQGVAFDLWQPAEGY